MTPNAHRRSVSEVPSNQLTLNQLGYCVDGTGMLRNVTNNKAMSEELEELEDRKFISRVRRRVRWLIFR